MNFAIFPPHRLTPGFTPHLPLSKSISNRALLLDALAGETPRMHGIAECDDTEAIVHALSDLNQHHIDIGAAGTAMGFLTAYLSSIDNHTFTID
ncbi:MAG: 3-phosphoshikimate 1-carboxyvinyltransferase, partial [Muribaculum sp.]|nr:3-phosphoshikimate 1-carboxyvinyltransferase [Muribaculum sp.]